MSEHGFGLESVCCYSLYQNSQSPQLYDHHHFSIPRCFVAKRLYKQTTTKTDRSIADVTELAQRLNISSDHKLDYSEDPLTHAAPRLLVARKKKNKNTKKKIKKYATNRCDLFYLGFAQKILQ